MPRATTGAGKRKVSANSPVLTLEEAAAHLRVNQTLVRQLAEQAALPARKIGDEWRFLRVALDEWLAAGPSARQRFLAVAGRWQGDPSIDELLAETYRHRGRPMLEQDE